MNGQQVDTATVPETAYRGAIRGWRGETGVTVKIVVTLLGLVAIVWVNYWFFFSNSVNGKR